jgi:hypothetical protein
MPRFERLFSALTLLVLAGCGEDQQSLQRQVSVPTVAVADVELVEPVLTRDLRTEAGTLLVAKDVIEDSGRLLVLTTKPEELWELAFEAPYALRRITEPRKFGQASVQAMAAHSNGVSFIGLDGRLRVMRPDAPDQLAKTVAAFPSMHRPLALGEWSEKRWLAIHGVITVLGTSLFADSVIVSAFDLDNHVTRVAAFERAGPGRPDAFFADLIGARVFRDRAVLVGTDPVRVVSLREQSMRVDSLLDAPQRPLEARSLEKLKKELESPRIPQFVRDSRFPDFQPAALAALPFATGFVVVAAISDDITAADLYCGNRFRRTVISRASAREMFVTENGLAVIDESITDASIPARLSFYRLQDFIPECTK